MTRKRYEGLVREFVRRVAEYNHKEGDGSMRCGLAMRHAVATSPKRIQEQKRSYSEAWESMKDIRKVFGM